MSVPQPRPSRSAPRLTVERLQGFFHRGDVPLVEMDHGADPRLGLGVGRRPSHRMAGKVGDFFRVRHVESRELRAARGSHSVSISVQWRVGWGRMSSQGPREGDEVVFVLPGSAARSVSERRRRGGQNPCHGGMGSNPSTVSTGSNALRLLPTAMASQGSRGDKPSWLARSMGCGRVGSALAEEVTETGEGWGGGQCDGLVEQAVVKLFPLLLLY